MAGGRGLQALTLVLIMMMAPLAGCFGENDDEGIVRSGDVTITPVTMIGGVFQGLTISADEDFSAFIPYLIKNQESGFIQNSTVLDLRAGDSVLLNVLAPPRTDTAVILLGEYGREEWPIRSIDESWRTWYDRSGFEAEDGDGIMRVDGENGTLDTVVSSNNSGGEVLAIRIAVERPMAAAYSEADGGRHSTGLVDGLNVFNYISHITDETADPTDAADGAVGYLDRWAGQGNAAYEDAAQYLIGRTNLCRHR